MQVEQTPRPSLFSKSTTFILLFIILPSVIHSQESWNVDLIAEHSIGTSAGDVWVSDHVAYLARFGSNGITIIDVSDPFNPTTLTTYSTSATAGTWDVKAADGYAYIAPQYSGVGLVILDVTNPSSPLLVTEYSHSRVTGSHNVWVDSTNAYAYLASNTSGEVEILDISNPSAPQHVASFGSFSGNIHDMVVVDGIMYASFLNGGLYLADVSDPTNPQLMGYVEYPDAFTHNAWPSKDGYYVFTTDEIPGGHVRVWDVRDPGNIQEVGSFQAGPPDAVIHNVLTFGDYLHISYYSTGYRIVDVSDPENPVEIGYYDSSGSAWGVFPFSGFAYVSDMDDGLVILNYNGQPYTVSISPDGPVEIPRGGLLEFNTIIDNNTENTPQGDYWLSVLLPNSNEIVIPEDFLNVPNPLPGQVPSFDLFRLSNSLDIPTGINAGSYALIGRVGVFPNRVIDESRIDFEVIE